MFKMQLIKDVSAQEWSNIRSSEFCKMARFQVLAVLIIVVLLEKWTYKCEGINSDIDSHEFNSQKVPVPSFRHLHRSECPSECKRRCSKTRKTACMDFCQYCCKKCLCVPPGTSGNKDVCPCYNNWKTKEGGPKCP